MCVIRDIKRQIEEARLEEMSYGAAIEEALKRGPDGRYIMRNAWFMATEAEEMEDEWFAKRKVLEAELEKLIAQGVVEEEVVEVNVEKKKTYVEVVGGVKVQEVQEVIKTAAGLPAVELSPLVLDILKSGMTRNGNDALSVTGEDNDPKYIIDTLGDWSTAPGKNGGFAKMVASMKEYQLNAALSWYKTTEQGREQAWLGCVGKTVSIRNLIAMCQICASSTSDDERIMRAVHFCAEKGFPMWTSGEFNYNYNVPDGSMRTGHVFMLMRLTGIVVALHNKSKRSAKA